jgi:glycosyltransferase involved in cell wall biosynthesis
MLLRAMAARADVTAVVDQKEIAPPEGVRAISIAELGRRAGEFDAYLCQLGNNPYHEFAYRWAIEHPSTIVLHDFVLHHLIVEMTLARGETGEYVEILRCNHGEAGAAWARGRAAGFHAELGNFLFPASIELARRSRHVIVHNEWARERLRSFGIDTPVTVVEHPLEDVPFDESPRRGLREKLGFGEDAAVVGMFGFVTSAKRPGVVFAAFARARERRRDLRLLVVGEPAPDVDLTRLAESHGIPRDAWVGTGYVADEEFDAYLSVADRVVNLRYPTAGETSGALLRVLTAGRPVAVSGYAQFAEYPAGVVDAIPLGGDEVERLAAFMAAGEEGEGRERRREWVRRHSSMDRAVGLYLEAVGGVHSGAEGGRVAAAIPLFPQLRLERHAVERSEGRLRVVMTLMNDGEEMLRGRSWGEPELRIVVKVLADGGVDAGGWLPLPGDVAPGASFEVDYTYVSPASSHRIEVEHALQSVPSRPGAVIGSFEVTV